MGRVSRLAKLRAMPFEELVSRTRYSAFTSVERQMHRQAMFVRPGRLRGGLVDDIRRQKNWAEVLVERKPAGAFFAPFDDGGAIRADVHRRFPEEVARAREVAAPLTRHEIEFFGETFRFGDVIDWHADPVTKAGWPRVYHRDVPVGQRTFGDPKYVWELNRHQFLMDVAKVALLEGEPVHRSTVEQIVRDWLRAVPYGTGAAWACALEPAFRAWSWIWAYHFLRAAGPLDDDFHLEWLTGFYDHGRFLYRHLETYTSPYNHLAGEASALFALGVLFKEFRESAAWIERGRGVLESTVGSQFHPDGGTVEQSTFYHHATLGFYLVAAILGRRNGLELNEKVWAAIERGIDFSVALVQPDGRVPSIGGADDGKPIRLEQLPFWDFRPYYAVGAVLFNRGDFKAAAARFWEDAYWLLGRQGADTFAALPANAPPLSRTLEASGYSVFRGDWSTDADYLCFDCGPQAAGLRHDDVPSAAHGHADCLSVIAWLGGRPVLVDPGFFCYNGDPEWEVHFRRTAAHNTLTVDGRDQAQHIAKMNWTRTYRASIEGSALDEAWAWVTGSHDGFTTAAGGVTHRRTAWLRSGGYLVIRDELSGEAGHEVRANFQFAPGDLVADGSGVVFDDRFEVVWACDVPTTPTIVSGGDHPSDGWIAPSLGVRRRAPRLTLDFALSLPRVILLTIVADRRVLGGGRRVAVPAEDRASGLGTLRMTVEGPGWRDQVVSTGGGQVVRAAGVETDAPLAVIRTADTSVQEARLAGGTLLRAGGREWPLQSGNERRLVTVEG